MHYFSTRGLMQGQSFSDALLLGLGTDGGLVVPEKYPRLDSVALERLRPLAYTDLAFEIMKLYVADIPQKDLKKLLEYTYTAKLFKTREITPVRLLKNGLWLLQLSNGPTLAFKDIAMQFLGNVLQYILNQRGEKLTILGATSGDTGSAAEYAMRNRSNLQVFMLSPWGKMSNFQRAQMYSVLEENIHNIAVKGVFDDCQDLIKTLQADLAFKSKYHIGTVNSINWGRILAQTVYYFKAYFAVTRNVEERVCFCVPSGNFGNVFAGHVAKQMGLPIEKLIVATNENNVLEAFFNSGIYMPRKANEVYTTSSPSMDIAKASNLERLIFDLVDKDGSTVKKLWEALNLEKRLDLSNSLSKLRNEFGFLAGHSCHKDRIETIRQVYSTDNYLVDPHTADGIFVALQLDVDGLPLICLETALPIKFADTMREALGEKISLDPFAEWESIEQKEQRFQILENKAEALKSLISSTLNY
ncbi:MAG: threonine synthase [Neisseriaceae bacterium]